MTATEATLHPLFTHVIYRLLVVEPKQSELTSSGQKGHLTLAFLHLEAGLALFQAPGPAHEFLQRKVSPAAKMLTVKL